MVRQAARARAVTNPPKNVPMRLCSFIWHSLLDIQRKGLRRVLCGVPYRCLFSRVFGRIPAAERPLTSAWDSPLSLSWLGVLTALCYIKKRIPQKCNKVILRRLRLACSHVMRALGCPYYLKNPRLGKRNKEILHPFRLGGSQQYGPLAAPYYLETPKSEKCNTKKEARSCSSGPPQGTQ